MRRPRRAGLVALAAALGVAAGGVAGAAGPEDDAASGWQGLLGSRPAPQLGGRWIVVFDAPSLADRVRAAGGFVDEARQKRWTAAAEDAQDRLLARLAADGAGFAPEHRYVRVVNAVAAALDPRVLPVLESEPFVAGVYPVRAAYPAALEAVAPTPRRALDPGDQPAVGIPGMTGRGIEVALVDTGVDLRHPYLQGTLLRGIDVVDPGGDARARRSPTEQGRSERHGTGLAGIVVGGGGPGGLRGVAPSASLRPIRVAGWQPDGSGGVSVYARTDQVIAGLEAAVDPDGDGSAHDAARVALIGVVEPFAAFEDGPLQRAATGAAALDVLVVAPAGNDGPAGPSFGSVGAPGGAATTLAVGAVDARRVVPTAHVLVRSGLEVLFSGRQPLGGSSRAASTTDVPVTALAAVRARTVASKSAFERLFDASGYSRVAGTAALLPAGSPAPETVRDLAQAGARAVVVDGGVPAGALGLDGAELLPIVGVPHDVAVRIRRLLAQRVPVRLSVGAAALRGNPTRSEPTAFSSDGLAFDGSPKPDVAAPGVGIVTAAPGRDADGTARYDTISGTSAAAAVVTGAAALLAQARPDLGAAELRSALVSSATPLAAGPGSSYGLVDPEAAATSELLAEPASLALGVAFEPGAVLGRGFTLRNTSRRLVVADVVAAGASGGTSVGVYPARVALRPGQTAQIGVSVTVGPLPAAPSALAGSVVVRIKEGATLRVPWVVAVPVHEKPLLSLAVVSPRSFRPSDTSPAVLTFTAGRVDGTAERPALLPLARVEIRLVRRGRVLGTLIRLRNVLPGRYAVGMTGRGPKGARLGPGDYELRIVARSVTGDTQEALVVPFAIEEPS